MRVIGLRKVVFILLSTLILVACGDDVASKPVGKEKDEPSQEELNGQLREEAIEANFVKINGDEVKEGTKLKVTGEITVLFDEGVQDGNFTLTTDEPDGGHGMYSIINLNTVEQVDIVVGEEVIVYGAYSGRDDDTGMPVITATIIE